MRRLEDHELMLKHDAVLSSFASSEEDSSFLRRSILRPTSSYFGSLPSRLRMIVLVGLGLRSWISRRPYLAM